MASVTPTEYLDLLRSAKYADFTIVCDQAEFKVHREVVCSASKVLANLDAALDTMQIPEVQPDIMARAILFMYGLTNPFYDEGIEETVELVEMDTAATAVHMPTPPPVQAALDDVRFEVLGACLQVHLCATLLRIKDLENFAPQRFMNTAPAALRDERLADVLRIIYKSPSLRNSGLRHSILNLCIKNHELILTGSERLQVFMEYDRNRWNLGVQRLGLSREPKATVLKDVTLAYLWGVSWKVDECALREVLESYGDVKYFKLIRVKASLLILLLPSSALLTRLRNAALQSSSILPALLLRLLLAR